jgi:leader peptidase (prepilin peptidase)/N-methyltransferase
VDVVGVAVAAAIGLGGGWLAGPIADRLAIPRYGPDSPDHDPEDLELAPMRVPTSARARLVLAAVGACSAAALAQPFADGEVVALLLVLGLLYLVAMVVDLQYLRLPNLCTYPAAGLALAGTLLLSARLDAPWSPAVVGAVTYSLLLLGTRALFAVVRGIEGLGLGDAKLAVSLGATLGWVGGLTDPITPVLGSFRLVVLSALVSNVLGAVFGLAIVRRLEKGFPFGPYLVAGWVVILTFADQLTA